MQIAPWTAAERACMRRVSAQLRAEGARLNAAGMTRANELVQQAMQEASLGATRWGMTG